jgi:hypothetical protein
LCLRVLYDFHFVIVIHWTCNYMVSWFAFWWMNPAADHIYVNPNYAPNQFKQSSLLRFVMCCWSFLLEKHEVVHFSSCFSNTNESRLAVIACRWCLLGWFLLLWLLMTYFFGSVCLILTTGMLVVFVITLNSVLLFSVFNCWLLPTVLL